MKNNYGKRRFSLLGPGWFWYVPLLIFAVVFTQMLRSSASSVLMGFVLILPVISFVHGIIGRSCIQVYVMTDKSTAEKMEPVSYEIRVINPSFMPYPFVTASILLPDKDGVRCGEGFVKIALVPFGGCFIKNSVAFRYRGSYGVGVEGLYISDMFRLFIFRKKESVNSSVTVYPRKLEFENPPLYSVTDIPSDTASPILGADRSEQSGIREYIPGDSLKAIHWKLSSKTQDLQVREFTTNDSRHVWVLCDLARRRTPASLEDAEADDTDVIKEVQSAERAAHTAGGGTAGAVKRTGAAAAKLFGKILGLVSSLFHRAADHGKRRRRIKRGMSERDAETVALIDQLILSNPKKRKKTKQGSDAAENAESSESAAVAVNDTPAISDEELERRIDELDGEKKYGGDGSLSTEFAADIDEYCADGVIEIAAAAVIRELMHGSRCTLAWYDTREDSGVVSCDIESIGDFEQIYHRFATAPVVPSEMEVADLASLVDSTGGATVRVVTANIDEYSEAAYEKMPSIYGGAGTGNITEVLLFNPEERYEDRAVRRSYIEMCRAGLAGSGVNMTEVRRFMYGDGVLRLVSVD